MIVADHEKDVWPRVKVIIGLPDGHTMPVPKEGQRIPLPPGVYRVDVCRSDNDLLLRRGWVKLIPGSKVFVELRMGYGLVPVPLSQRRPEAELLGHANEITCAVFSADGEMVATASWDKTVKLWKRNGSEWREGLTLEGHTGRVRCVAFAPDGSVVATASEDGTVKLWSVATGQETATLTEHVGEVCAVAFSPDGAILASAGEDRSIRLWDWKQRQLVKTLRGHAEHVLCIAFSPDGESLASGAGDRTIKLWSITAGQERYTLSGHTRKVMSLAFAPDGATLASESEDAMVMLWDTVSGRIVRTLGVRGHAGGADAVAGVAFSPDGKVLATGGPYVVKLWDPSTGALYDEFHAHWKRIRSVRFSPSGNMLLTGSRDFTARLWRVPTEMRVKRKSPHPIASFPYGFAPFVAFHPHELRFAVPQHHGGGLEIWHTEGSGTQPVLLQETVEGLGKRGAVGSSAAFLPDGKTVITCGSDNCWRIWDSETCRLLETIENDLPLRRLAVAPDGKTIAAIQTSEGLPSWRRECKTAKVWNVESKEAIRTLHSPRGRITRVAFSPDSKLIAACTHLGGVILFDAETGKEVDVLVEYGFTPASGPLPSAALESMIYCLAFSPDGGTLACQKDLSTVQLWDVAQRKPIGTFSHDATDIVMSVAFSPDGRILATAGGNYDLIGSQEMSTLPKVKLWDASTGGLLAEFAGHIAPVARVSFSRDGTILATCGTADAKLNLWRVAELLQAGATPKEESPPSDTEDKSPE
ncbi:MAG: WD40 repeat domain-containing protein [Planctomycetes bacterium]|nr:WD40 repeat domain-containing protein [Planctomycetota bacterium]